MNVLRMKLSNAKLKEAKVGQHREGILLSGTIAAGQPDTAKVEVGSAGAIVTMRMSGMFTTLDLVGGHVIDDGICHIRGQLFDTDKNTALFNDFVPLSLFLSPGRIKDKAAENYKLDVALVANRADPGGFLYEMQEFTHPFTVGAYIKMDVKNDAAYANKFYIYFDVIRVTRP